MGHRRTRKRDRKADRQFRRGSRDLGLDFSPDPFDDSLMALLPVFEDRDAPAPAKQCGVCVEFVEDREGGRGTCLHPGSGVLSPWTDTEACAFYSGRR